MRFKVANKGSLATVVYGLSNSEKDFKRTIVCIRENGDVYKVLTVTAGKDGSIYISFNYCKEKKAYIFRHQHTYKPGRQLIKPKQITHEFEVDKTAKLALHKDGFVQISGKGIKSGIDLATGKPKGIGIFSSPLETPVSSGPTFCFSCWGQIGRAHV